MYNNTTARITINGHQSNVVQINRGFEQGDAFSNGLFNLAIDTLIRNIIASRVIIMIRLISPTTSESVGLKSGAYVDDVFAICRGDCESVNGIFK